MVSTGDFGAPDAATCSPTRTVCPGASGTVHPAPAQVTEVLGTTVQVIPQAFTTPVTVGSRHDTDHDEAFDAAFTSSSAT